MLPPPEGRETQGDEDWGGAATIDADRQGRAGMPPLHGSSRGGHATSSRRSHAHAYRHLHEVRRCNSRRQIRDVARISSFTLPATSARAHAESLPPIYCLSAPRGYQATALRTISTKWGCIRKSHDGPLGHVAGDVDVNQHLVGIYTQHRAGPVSWEHAGNSMCARTRSGYRACSARREPHCLPVGGRRAATGILAA